jgi:hypothetical protein
VGYPSRVSGKGKAGPSEAGRGKYSPPGNPERVTSEALKRRDNGVLWRKTESSMKSKGWGNPPNKNQETPGKRMAPFTRALNWIRTSVHEDIIIVSHSKSVSAKRFAIFNESTINQRCMHDFSLLTLVLFAD